MSLAILFHFFCAQHVSDINISIIKSLRLCCWITTSVVLFSARCVLEIWCGWFWVVLVLQAEAEDLFIHCYALHNTTFQGNLASAYLRAIIRPPYKNAWNKLYSFHILFIHYVYVTFLPHQLQFYPLCNHNVREWDLLRRLMNDCAVPFTRSYV